MTKRKYKNFVRKHRKKYPKKNPNVPAKSHQEDQHVGFEIQEGKPVETQQSSKPILSNYDSSPLHSSVPERKDEMISEFCKLHLGQEVPSNMRRSEDLRVRRAKRRAQDPET